MSRIDNGYLIKALVFQCLMIINYDLCPNNIIGLPVLFSILRTNFKSYKVLSQVIKVIRSNNILISL